MKKCLLFLVLFLFNISKVEAYSTISRDDFYESMNKGSYKVSILENSFVGIKEDKNGALSEIYKYISFETTEEATRYVKNIYDSVASSYHSVHLEDSYNFDTLVESPYSYFSLDYYRKENGLHRYMYYYRYDNIVVSGESFFDDKDTVVSVLQSMYDKYRDFDLQFEDNGETTGDVKKSNHQISGNIYVIIGGLLIVILCIFLWIRLNSKSDNKKQTG